MSNLIKRTITGSIFIGLTVLLVLINEWTFLFFALLLNTFSTYEIFKILKTDKRDIFHLVLTILIGTFSILTTFFYFKTNCPIEIFFFISLPILLLFIYELFANNNTPANDISHSLLSLFYISLPIILSTIIVFGNDFHYQTLGDRFYPEILLGILILIWTNDTMAYCFGVSFGRHKLMKRISPKKSWEGFIGGAIMSIIAGYFLTFLLPVLGRTDWIVISVIVVCFGSLGDLIESMFKRSASIKDSGKILPGHGGVLDRFDSFIFAIPFVFIYFIINKLFF